MNILQTIQESILNEAAAEQYISLAKKHDWAYFYSDSERVYRTGRQTESKLRELYDSLSDEDKITAARWFKDNYPINDSSKHSTAIKNWDIDNDGVDGFDGVHYSQA